MNPEIKTTFCPVHENLSAELFSIYIVIFAPSQGNFLHYLPRAPHIVTFQTKVPEKKQESEQKLVWVLLQEKVPKVKDNFFPYYIELGTSHVVIHLLKFQFLLASWLSGKVVENNYSLFNQVRGKAEETGNKPLVVDFSKHHRHQIPFHAENVVQLAGRYPHARLFGRTNK